MQQAKSTGYLNHPNLVAKLVHLLEDLREDGETKEVARSNKESGRRELLSLLQLDGDELTRFADSKPR